jgi:hypothetical protein
VGHRDECDDAGQQPDEQPTPAAGCASAPRAPSSATIGKVRMPAKSLRPATVALCWRSAPRSRPAATATAIETKASRKVMGAAYFRFAKASAKVVS